MTVVFYPSAVSGTVYAPPSKSMAHRALIAAALADGQSTVDNLTSSDDVLATVDCLRALGAKIDLHSDLAVITGIRPEDIPDGAELPCRESGSTLRFLIPFALTTGKEITFTGSPRLFARPVGIYEEICRNQGISFLRGKDRLTVCGRLLPGKYRVPGNVSSQFISGLCFALPFLDGDSEIDILPPVQSAPYLELTLHTLSQCGIRITRSGNRLMIPGGRRISPFHCRLEGDWTNAAYLSALGLSENSIHVAGLNCDSLQGDRVYPALFTALQIGSPALDLSDHLDLGPVCFVLAAAWNGGTFTGTGRLRLKESDRIDSMESELRKFGARLESGADSVTVLPAPLHAPDSVLSSHNDHRIVMALSVLASRYGGTIRGAEAVNKSFPGYFDSLRQLGIRFCLKDEM